MPEKITEDIQPYNAPSLYSRLGGYDSISAVCEDLIARLRKDEQLGRFWKNRPQNSTDQELQLLKNFLSANAGGPVLYTGRDMKTSHRGMGISESGWTVFLDHVGETLNHFDVAARESDDVLNFLLSQKTDVIDP